MQQQNIPIGTLVDMYKRGELLSGLSPEAGIGASGASFGLFVVVSSVVRWWAPSAGNLPRRRLGFCLPGKH